MATKAQKAEQDAKVKAAVAAAANECTADTEKQCPGMTFALALQGERGGGIEVGISMDLAKGETETVFVYRTMKGNKLLELNHCPWCGANVRRSPGQDGGGR